MACYASKDLDHWQFRNQVEKAVASAKLGPGWILERPKVFYNSKTRTVGGDVASRCSSFRPGELSSMAKDELRQPLNAITPSLPTMIMDPISSTP